MIYFSDGSHSNYYEGLNLVLLAFLVTNSFVFSHVVVFGLVVLGMYTLAAAMNDGLANVANAVSAMFFMSSTLVFSGLIAWLYGIQYRQQFIATEELKKNEAKLAAAYQVVKTQAETDELTGLYSRRAFWLILVDVDNLKEINDTYGHLVGDDALRAVAGALVGQVRRNTYVGRYGGDEFILILDEASREQILKRLGQFRDAIRGVPFQQAGREIPISASFGAAEFHHDAPIDMQGLIKQADWALLEVKGTRRGEIRLTD